MFYFTVFCLEDLNTLSFEGLLCSSLIFLVLETGIPLGCWQDSSDEENR